MVTALNKTFDFPVEKVPLVTTDGLKTNACGIVRRDKNRVIATVTSKYQLIPHADAVNAVFRVFDSLSMRIQPRIAVSQTGARMHASFIIDQSHNLGGDDYLNPQLILRNSYDRSCGVILDVGFFRAKCSNGMVAADNLHSIRTRHYMNSVQFEPLQNTLKVALETIPALVQSYRDMRGKRITMDEFNRMVDEVKQKISAYEKKQNEFASFCNRKFKTEQEQNLWAAYNVLTYFVTHRLKNELRKFSLLQHIDRTARRF